MCIRDSAGEGLAEPCQCVGDESAPPITRINGIRGTNDGDFTILGSDCVGVESLINGIRITDPCSQPCCSCRELEVINEDLRLLNSNALTLQNFVNNLNAFATQPGSSNPSGA